MRRSFLAPGLLVSLACFQAAVFGAESLSPLPAPVTPAPRAAALTAVPSAPPDWRVEILAQPPQLIHPSVVCALVGSEFSNHCLESVHL
jgi:hypothetical protein